MTRIQNDGSWASSETAKRVMRGNRGRDTTPELHLRRELHSRGLRYRVNLRVPSNLRRSIDIAFTGPKLAVFMDGCFWHGCPIHRAHPKTNADFWMAKIERNILRDQGTNQLLEEEGWTVIRVWEHDDIMKAADRIQRQVEWHQRNGQCKSGIATRKPIEFQ